MVFVGGEGDAADDAAVGGDLVWGFGGGKGWGGTKGMSKWKINHRNEKSIIEMENQSSK